MDERLKKWRLILGKKADPLQEIQLEGGQGKIDDTLEALYDSDRKAGLGSSSPNVNRWLGDIRSYFPTSVVQIMQKDALERLHLEKLLLEPQILESIEPDIHLVATILSLNKVMPNETKETARQVVQQLVKKIQQELNTLLIDAVQGSINKASRIRKKNPKSIDWHATIRLNLKNYQPELGAIIPDNFVGYQRKRTAFKHITLLVDQSGSMASSVVYAGILGATLASVPSIQTSLVVFDTNPVDLSPMLNDPVDLLFGTQLGGGTNISKALKFTTQLITNPADAILVLITDLHEGGNVNELLSQIHQLLLKDTQIIVLLALNDQGAPSYNRSLAGQLASLNIPVFACTPEKFPQLISAAIEKKDISNWMAMHDIEWKG